MNTQESAMPTGSTAAVVPLGATAVAGLRNGLGPRGWFFHLPEAGWVVLPQTRQSLGWRCEVIAAIGGGVTGRHVLIGNDDVDTLPTTLTMGSEDAEGFVL